MPTPQQLQARLAAATPEDTVRGLVFNALFDAVEEHAGRPAAVACDPAGKAHRTDFFSFPVTEFLPVVARAIEALEPRLGSADRAYFEIGYRSVANLLGSSLGATIAVMARKDPRALLGQTPTAYRGTVSYGERRLEWLGERHARLTFKRDFMATPFHCGVLTATVEAAGARNVRVESQASGPLDATYEVRWEA